MKLFPFLLLAALGAGCLVDDGTELGELDSELSVDRWTTNTQIQSQSSVDTVGTAYFSNQLYMVHGGGTAATATQLSWTRREEATGLWLSAMPIPGQYALGTPTLVVHDAQLRLIYRAAGSGHLRMSTFDPAARTWGTAVAVGTQVGANSAPSAVVVDGDLYLAYCKRHGGSYRTEVDVLRNQAWSSVGPSFLSNQECPFVAIGSETRRDASGRLQAATLHLAHVGYHDTIITQPAWTVWIKAAPLPVAGGAVVDGQPPVWSEAGNPGWKSKRPISVVECNGVTHLVHSGRENPTEMYWTHLSFGRWIPEKKIPGQSSNAGASLGCADDQTFLIHHGYRDNQLWYSEYQ